MTSFVDGKPSAALVRLQRVLTRMTEQLFAYCEAREIALFLVAGSALGAERHGAIIAWDDDVDLGLERTDYDRFIAMFQADPIPGMTLQCWQTEPEYPYSFAKVRLLGTQIRDLEFDGKDLHRGIFVDIFPYDNVPANGLLEVLQRYGIGLLNLFIERPEFADPHRHFSSRRKMFRIAARHLGVLLPAPHRLARLRDQFLRMRWARKGDQLDCLGMFGTNAVHRTRITRTVILPPIEGRLGDIAVKVPARPDDYLTRMYSDWRSLPPEGHRRPLHLTAVDFGEHPWAQD